MTKRFEQFVNPSNHWKADYKSSLPCTASANSTLRGHEYACDLFTDSADPGAASWLAPPAKTRLAQLWPPQRCEHLARHPWFRQNELRFTQFIGLVRRSSGKSSYQPRVGGLSCVPVHAMVLRVVLKLVPLGQNTGMKIILGFVVAFAIGAMCRLARIPSPAPNAILGALLVVAMTVGYVLADRWLK